MHYADALRAVGRLEEAAAEIEAALKVSPDLPQAVEIKRRIDRAQGRRESPATERPDGKGA